MNMNELTMVRKLVKRIGGRSTGDKKKKEV